MMKAKYMINYQLHVETGLHIGGYKENFGIGGVDNPVIKNPLTQEPFIPGTSLKGKLRSLVEMVYAQEELVRNNGQVTKGNRTINRLFGKVPNEQQAEGIELTRLVFRDAFLTDETKQQLALFLGEGVYTETKAENSINRLKGTAENPRFVERVPAGSVFAGTLIFTEYEGDNVAESFQVLNSAFRLLEDHYLGGSGSRGYGKVRFEVTSVMQRSADYYRNGQEEVDVTSQVGLA